MSPEQARGAPVDKRTDVWAFGCVLFEMLAGRHVFGGAGTVSDAIAAVLKSEPDWHALPANTPPHIRSLLKRCLEKDPRHRLRDIGDAGLLLGDTSSVSEDHRSAAACRRQPLADRGGSRGQPSLAGSSRRSWRSSTPPGSLADSAPSHRRLQRRCGSHCRLPSQAMATNANWRESFAISSDGTRFVYVGRDSTGSSLYLQDLVSGELKRLAETAGADAPTFSPDGRAIAFHVRIDNQDPPSRWRVAARRRAGGTRPALGVERSRSHRRRRSGPACCEFPSTAVLRNWSRSWLPARPSSAAPSRCPAERTWSRCARR